MNSHIELNQSNFPLLGVKPTKFGREIANAVIDLWPLLGLSILFAYASGVIMWMVDTWSNKDHFPRQFLSGTFEGE